MSQTAGLRGLANVSFYAEDLAAAQRWYTEVLGVAAYFSRPGYVEFRIGDYQAELGIIDAKYAPAGLARGAGGAIVYWHVDDLAATVERLVALGAAPLEPIVERGPGFVTASVVDPFGNVLGVMYNRHYLDILAR
jgi:predicted enzyme related to lactoylglutathione lyase